MSILDELFPQGPVGEINRVERHMLSETRGVLGRAELIRTAHRYGDHMPYRYWCSPRYTKKIKQDLNNLYRFHHRNAKSEATRVENARMALETSMAK